MHQHSRDQGYLREKAAKRAEARAKRKPFNYIQPDPNRKEVKPIGTDGFSPGIIRTRLSDFEKRKCPKCGKMNYDFLECVYCQTDLKEVEPETVDNRPHDR